MSALDSTTAQARHGRVTDWERREAEVAGLAELASAVAAFGSKVPPSGATVRRWQELPTPALVALAQAGHREAFDPLYRRYAPEMLRRTLRLVNGNRELAQDVASETWAAAIANIGRWVPRDDDDRAFVKWLCGINKQSSLRRFHHALKERPVDTTESRYDTDQIESLWAPTDNGGDTAMRARIRTWVRSAIASMPAASQRVIWLKLDGLAAADIARELNVTEAVVSAIWYRFCERCKDTAGAQGAQVQKPVLDSDPAKLRAAAQALTPAPRRVVELLLDGLTCREIAEHLGRCLGGVYNYCCQARKTFAAQGLALPMHTARTGVRVSAPTASRPTRSGTATP